MSEPGWVPDWLPDRSLVADLRRALTQAPAESAEQRFEAWSWASLLGQVGPGLLTRAAAPGHVTASAVVLDDALTHTCLVLHGRIGLWVQPGGHLEEGDLSLPAAAARETVEETGLTGRTDPVPLLLSRHRAPCRPGVVDWHLDVQHLIVAPRRPPTVSAESKDVAWWPVQDLPADLAPGVGGAVTTALTRARR